MSNEAPKILVGYIVTFKTQGCGRMFLWDYAFGTVDACREALFKAFVRTDPIYSFETWCREQGVEIVPLYAANN